jgi:hypothetical protein
MSSANTPEQSLAGAGLPPALLGTVRRTGVFWQNQPPWKGSAALPFVP